MDEHIFSPAKSLAQAIREKKVSSAEVEPSTSSFDLGFPRND